MLNETPMFPEVNYPNPKEFLSTHGYDAPPLLLHISSANKGHAQLVKVKQLTSKSVVLSRIFAVTHLFIPRQNNVHDNTSNQLRSEAMRASTWYCIWAFIIIIIIIMLLSLRKGYYPIHCAITLPVLILSHSCRLLLTLFLIFSIIIHDFLLRSISLSNHSASATTLLQPSSLLFLLSLLTLVFTLDILSEYIHYRCRCGCVVRSLLPNHMVPSSGFELGKCLLL
uniref:Uncharacterized protein n=1 Tax=Octopus bimaculoides TaxID=37653 RepID=A0A0L8HEN8_OCTBM